MKRPLALQGQKPTMPQRSALLVEGNRPELPAMTRQRPWPKACPNQLGRLRMQLRCAREDCRPARQEAARGMPSCARGTRQARSAGRRKPPRSKAFSPCMAHPSWRAPSSASAASRARRAETHMLRSSWRFDSSAYLQTPQARRSAQACTTAHRRASSMRRGPE